MKTGAFFNRSLSMSTGINNWRYKLQNLLYYSSTVWMNSVSWTLCGQTPFVEAPLTVNNLLYYTDILVEINMAELSPTVRKYGNIVRLLRNKKHICSLNKNNAVSSVFLFPFCRNLSNRLHVLEQLLTASSERVEFISPRKLNQSRETQFF